MPSEGMPLAEGIPSEEILILDYKSLILELENYHKSLIINTF